MDNRTHDKDLLNLNYKQQRETIKMKTYNDNATLTSFNFWSGAKDNASYLTYTELKELEDVLDDIFTDGIEETALNDLFWFEFETVCEWLGLDVEEVYNREGE